MIKGIQTLEELCSRTDITDLKEWINRAIKELTPEGLNGSCALAKLIKELLDCRNPNLPYVLIVALELEPTSELIEVIRSIISAPNLALQPSKFRFPSEITGEKNLVGWTDKTTEEIKLNADVTLNAMVKKQENQNKIKLLNEKNNQKQKIINEGVQKITELTLPTEGKNEDIIKSENNKRHDLFFIEEITEDEIQPTEYKLNHKKIIDSKRKTFIFISLAIVLLGIFIIAGFSIYRKVKSKIEGTFDPAKAESITQTMISYQLLPGYKPIMGFDMIGEKVSCFARENNKQIILIWELRKKKLSNEEFKKFFWSIDKKTDSSWYDRNKNLQLQMNDIREMQVKDKGVLTLQDGTEVPYIVSSFVSEGENKEGFWGVINFKNSNRTILIFDMADKDNYNFDLTKEFVETIGPPK